MRATWLVAGLLTLVCGTAWAGPKELGQERGRLLLQGKAPLTEKEEADLNARGWRERRVGEFDTPVSATSRPADYAHDGQRGTVEYSPTWSNYVYHRVRIADGTVIERDAIVEVQQPDGTMRPYRVGCNFAQLVPDTDAIVREAGVGHNLTFRGCNLVNVRTYDDWTLEACNTSQHDRIGVVKANGAIELHDSVLVGASSKVVDANRQKPVGVLDGKALAVEGDAVDAVDIP
jgi:hypothetical protein